VTCDFCGEECEDARRVEDPDTGEVLYQCEDCEEQDEEVWEELEAD
jgi:hypothetical protein